MGVTKSRLTRGIIGGIVLVGAVIAGLALSQPSSTVTTAQLIGQTPKLSAHPSETNDKGSPYSCTEPSNANCDFAQDATNFVGTNNPNGQPGSGGLTNEVDNNLWNAQAGETQSIGANSAQDWEVVNSAPTSPCGGCVTTYPNAWTHGYGGVVDDYTSLGSTASFSMPNVGGVDAHGMYDNWLSQPSAADNVSDYEVMIQFDRVNDGPCPSGSWPGTAYAVTATSVMFGGSPWFLCDGQYSSLTSTNGYCPKGCGALVWKPGTSESSPVSESSVSLDLKAMYQWLETHDPPGYSFPYMQPGSAVTDIDAGFEIMSTGGVTEDFFGTGFTVDAVGAPSPPSTTPSGFTFTAGSGHTCALSWGTDSQATKGYDIYEYATGAGAGNSWFRANASTTVFKAAASGVTFNAEVADSNTGGQGPWSSYQTCTTT